MVAKESLSLFTAKLDELVKLDKDRLSKAKSLCDELIQISSYLEIDIARLPPECREAWAPLWYNIKVTCLSLLADIDVAFNDAKEKQIRLNDLYTTKTSEAFSKKVAELLVLQGKILAILLPKFAKNIPEFCHATNNTYKAIKNELKSSYISTKITNKEKSEKLLQEFSNQLKLHIEKLNGCEERDVATYKFGMDSRTGNLICTIRWNLIVISALFDELTLKPSTDFMNARNQSIHRFDEIDCLREREALKLIIEYRCVPYDKIFTKEGPTSELSKRMIDEVKETKGLPGEIVKKQRQEELPPPPAPIFKPS